ncbi:MAG: class II glutamine amidotransferase, partial [Gammaproteobacteria bacterium]
MCGIVGVAAERNVTELLLEGLRRLEYRGYDSSGMAVIDNNDDLQRLRRLGKVSELTEAQKTYGLSGRTGIAHTRWATHGQPSESNAHPHQSSSQLAVVHNGIIENYEALREELSASGYVFESETDTETIVHLVHSYLSEGDLLSAVQKAVARLDGAYAIAVIDAQNPETIVACRKGSPL